MQTMVTVETPMATTRKSTKIVAMNMKVV